MSQCTMKAKTILFVIPSSAVILLFLFSFTQRGTKDFLRVSGNKVIDAAGNAVLFRGLNLEFKDFKTILTEKDIRRISDIGANSVRLVLDFRDLETPSRQYREEGFGLLDSILSWCEKYQIFVILDLHLAPGVQNPHDFVVHREKTYRFWERSDFQERFYALWEEIARRYADRKIVAGYDLLNEGVPPSMKAYRHVIDCVAGRIRGRDKNHILIVEEAILPDGTKGLDLINDRNTMYSVHFFYPPEFSFYATTVRRPITTYPGEMVTVGESIAETRSEAITGTSGWRRVQIEAMPPEGSEILVVKVTSVGNRGTVWLDDLHLVADGRKVDLPAPLIDNASFETEYPGFTWDMNGRCVTVSETHARTGKHSLAFSGCRSAGSAESSPIQVGKSSYILTAWYRPENATGDTHLSLSWHKRKRLTALDKTSVLEGLRYAVEFRDRNHVPLYIGEFTAHANPSPESVVNYLRDLLDFMEDEGLHWSFWEYYSVYPGVGIFTGDPPHIVNQPALDVLSRYMKKR